MWLPGSAESMSAGVVDDHSHSSEGPPGAGLFFLKDHLFFWVGLCHMADKHFLGHAPEPGFGKTSLACSLRTGEMFSSLMLLTSQGLQEGAPGGPGEPRPGCSERLRLDRPSVRPCSSFLGLPSPFTTNGVAYVGEENNFPSTLLCPYLRHSVKTILRRKTEIY